MRKLLMSLLMVGSLLAAGIGNAVADDASAPAAASAPDTTATTASAPAADASAAPAASAPADASAAAAPAAPTAPFSVDSSKISSGDTAWMLTSTALVLFMTIPGLALFYGGMVRKKNVLATVMQSFAITCLVTVIWTVIGYSLAFTPGNSFIGGFSRVFLSGMNYIKTDKATTLTVSHLATTIPESVYFCFQLTFAIITPALITGAFADRMKFSSMLVFMTLWSILVYSPIAHMVWEPTGWLASAGILDFAGGTVVHINAGIAALVCALVLGKRTGYGKDVMAPHNLVLTMIGGSMLWVGWFGFNAGSAVAQARLRRFARRVRRALRRRYCRCNPDRRVRGQGHQRSRCERVAAGQGRAHDRHLFGRGQLCPAEGDRYGDGPARDRRGRARRSRRDPARRTRRITGTDQRTEKGTNSIRI
jgi:Amt family ammonium transporter